MFDDEGSKYLNHHHKGFPVTIFNFVLDSSRAAFKNWLSIQNHVLTISFSIEFNVDYFKLKENAVVSLPVESNTKHSILSESSHKEINVFCSFSIFCKRPLQQRDSSHSEKWKESDIMSILQYSMSRPLNMGMKSQLWLMM